MFRRSQLTTSSPKGTQVHPIKNFGFGIFNFMSNIFILPKIIIKFNNFFF
jgi:hypothetical protein